MEHLSNDHKNCTNQHENSHKLSGETGHPIVNLMKSQWKLRKQYDQSEFSNGRKVIIEQILTSEEKNRSKKAGL